MGKKFLVSVIIPTYKRPGMLSRAIDSVLNQTYDNIEIIVVDDNDEGSEYRKETEDFMDKYKNEKITYLKHKKNQGAPIARNNGLYKAKGKYVCFLDDDDEFLKDKIELQVNKFINSDKKLSVVGGFANILDEDNNLIRVEKTEINGDVFKRQLSINIATTSIAMIDKEIALLVGGFDNLKSSQEHHFFIKIFNKNPYYDYVNKPVINIYMHSKERISTNNNKPKGAIQLYHKVLEIIKDYNENEKKNIIHNQLKNVINAYIVVGNRIKAMAYLKKLIINDKRITLDAVKSIIYIIFGFENINKIKALINIRKCDI